jgi:ABC-type branched-subunit amino acid transport system ATPase component
VRLAGEDITGKAPHQVRRRGIAMVQQTPRPFPTMTVLENVALGALFGRAGAHHEEEEALELAGEALSLVGLGDRRHHHVGTLNLHQLRFLELARAVAGQPRVLLLDEVMAGLNDAELETSMGMVRAIRDRHGITVVWVEHVMKAVMKLAQRVVVLNFGKILAEGAPEHVMRDPAVVEAYLGQEAGDA